MLADLRRSFGLSFASAIVATLTFAYLLVAGRALTPALYADFSAGYAFFTFIAVAISPSAPMTARLLARYRMRGDDMRLRATRAALRRMLVRGTLAIGIPASLLVLPLANALHFRSPATLFLALLSSLVFTIVNFERGVLQGTGGMRKFAWNILVEAAIRLLFALAILTFWSNPAAIFSAHVLALSVAFLALPRLPAERAGVPTGIEWPEVRRLAGALFVAMLGMAVFQNSDVFLVKRMFASRDAGLFGAAAVIGRSIGVVGVAIYLLAGPLLAETHERGEAVRSATFRLAAVFLALAIVPVTILFLWSDRVTALLYGLAFRPAGAWVGSLAILSVVTSLHLIIGQGLITLHDRRFAPVYLIAAIAQIIALFLARSISAMIQLQFAVQGILLLLLTILLARTRTEHAQC
jgi:O-antigen/teichoic acid export membrane protein